MTNLMKMRFGDFEFPVNPAELQVELAALLRESVSAQGGTQVQPVGVRKKRVRGKGFFTGEEAMVDYLRLEGQFGEPHTLFLPGRRPFEAVLSELTLSGVQEKNVVAYSFTFVETAGKAEGVSGRTYTAKGGESLWDYAYFSGVSIDRLAAANCHLACIASLAPGEKVYIP